MEIVFIDEDDLPLANLMEHMKSDDDFELVQDEEEADTPNRTPIAKQIWNILVISRIFLRI